MKRLKTILTFLMLPLMLSPALSWGEGEHGYGAVAVGTNFLGNPYVNGSFSVRYNPNVSMGWMSIQVTSGGNSVSISGKDSATGTLFTCYVPKTSAHYPVAFNAATAGVEGLSVFASRVPTQANCNDVSIRQDSTSLN